MARLTARFSVTGWDEQPLEGIDGDWVGAVRMSKTFSTGLIGTSTALFASSGPVEGHRAYVAIERIEGSTDDGRTGCVTVHHGGLESDPRTWRPVCPHLLHNELESRSGGPSVRTCCATSSKPRSGGPSVRTCCATSSKPRSGGPSVRTCCTTSSTPVCGLSPRSSNRRPRDPASNSSTCTALSGLSSTPTLWQAGRVWLRNCHQARTGYVLLAHANQVGASTRASATRRRAVERAGSGRLLGW